LKALPAELPSGQLVVAQVTALVGLSTQRVLLAGPNGDVPAFDEVRWADTLPLMVQARLIQSFENAGYVRVVSDGGLGMGDFHLGLDHRAFHIVPGPKPAAEVIVGAKLADGDGKVIAAETFTGQMPVARTDDATTATEALNEAFAQVASDLVAWALNTMTASEAALSGGRYAPSAPRDRLPLPATPSVP
jgi:phospholipid/cholesterol/gamma-HCH transport system substrate-binding protein